MKSVNSGIGPTGYFEHYYGSRDWRFYNELLSFIISRSAPGPILDMGAGTGLFVECATRWGLQCQGIEGSTQAIEIARNRLPKSHLTQHLLSEPFPFEDGSFQTVVMNQVIEHLELDVARNCLKEAYRVLAPGGMIYVSSPSKYDEAEAQADPTHQHLYSPKSLRALISSCGFVDVVSLDYPLNMLGSRVFGRIMMKVVFRLTQWDRLSATANCVAFKKAAKEVKSGESACHRVTETRS